MKKQKKWRKRAKVSQSSFKWAGLFNVMQAGKPFLNLEWRPGRHLRTFKAKSRAIVKRLWLRGLKMTTRALVALKKKILHLWSSLKHRALSAFKKSFKLSLVFLSGLFLTAVIMGGRQIHSNYLSWATHGKVFKACANQYCNSGSGTAFLVRAASGKSFILTNSHVCRMGKGHLYLTYVGSEKPVVFKSRVLKDSDETDLCLLENNSGNDGLFLDLSAVSYSDILTVMGHPMGDSLTVTQGHAVSVETIRIDIGIVLSDNLPEEAKAFLRRNYPYHLMEKAQCSEKKHKIREWPIIPYMPNVMVGICSLVIQDAVKSTIEVAPGSSGSPVLSYWGRVVGIIFAMNGPEKRSFFIGASEIKKFLSQH